MPTLQRLDPDEILAAIAEHDPTAADLGRRVLVKRTAAGGDVLGWVEQLEKARLSLLSSFKKTRLASIAREELGLPPPDLG